MTKVPPHQQNVFVGISLRNKTLTAQGVQRILTLAREELGARRLLFVLADELELINLRVMEKGTEEGFRKTITEQARSLEAVIAQGVEGNAFPSMHVHVARWRDILNAQYWALYTEVFARFVESSSFRADLEEIAISFAARRGRSVTGTQLHHLAMYLIGELPTLLGGVDLSSKRYRTMIYPSRGTEAIDELAFALSSGKYGECVGCERVCTVRRMEL